MIDTKLIIFEGIPGSGKTTTSQLLHKHILQNGKNSNIYIEGCEHPIDLPFYAYLSLSEYDDIIYKYRGQAEWMKQNSIIEDDYALSPYKTPEPYPWDEMLIEYLSSREFCYSSKPIVSFDTFKKVFYKRFERYVAKMITENVITIFESVLLQHQIHDINRLYPDIKNNEIIEYLKNITNILSPLNPVLFYISQDNVKESLRHTALIRSKPSWSSEETIAYYEKRKSLELEAMENFSFSSVVLDNTNYYWNKMLNTILNYLSLV